MKNKTILIISALIILSIGFVGGYFVYPRTSSGDQVEVDEKKYNTKKEDDIGYYPEPIRGRPNLPEVNNVYQQGVTFVIDLDTKGHDEIAGLIDGIRDNVTNKEFDRSYNETMIWDRRDNIPYDKWLTMTDEERIAGMSGGGNPIYYRITDAVLARITEYNSYGLQKQYFDKLYNYFVNQGFTEDISGIGIGGTHSNTAFLKDNLICQLSVGPEMNNKNIIETEILCGYYDEPLSKS